MASVRSSEGGQFITGLGLFLLSAYFEMLQDDAKIRNYLAEQMLKQGATGQ